MDCKTIKRLLSDYIDGILTEELEKKFNEHLNTCNECRKLVEDILLISNHVKKIQVPELNPYLFQRIKHAVETRSKVRRFRIVYRLAMGMSFLLIAFGLVLQIFKPVHQVARRDNDLYIIKEEHSGYQFPVYAVKENYILTSYEGGTF